MTAEDIGRQIVRLMSRGPGALQPSQVALKDGTFFTGVPFSIQLGSQQTAVVQFIVDDEHAPRVIPLDEIGSIT